MALICPLTSEKHNVILADKLLSFVTYLEGIVTRNTFDYSALHIVSKWLSQSISGAHAHFNAVDRHVTALSEVLSLSSGVGLSEIWSGLSHQGAGMRDADKIRQLDAAAQRIPGGAKSMFIECRGSNGY